MAGISSLYTHLRGVGFMIPFVSYLLLADVTLSFLLPFKRLAPRLVYDISSTIASSVWLFIQRIFTRFNDAEITISGDAIPTGESAIIICNHVAWCDFYMIQALAIQSEMLGRCRYFAKKQLRIVPFLGWGLWAMGMPMVSRNWLRDRSELNRVFLPMIRGNYPTWLVSFSESTRFSEDKYEKSMAWCKETGHPQPKHLLYPRTKGFVATVQRLREASHITAVYDLTLCYQRGHLFQQPPSMWESLSMPGLSSHLGYRFHLHAQRFPLESLPEKDEELALWLEHRWVEKGDWLGAQRQNQAQDGSEDGETM